jgi:hypothetical protein
LVGRNAAGAVDFESTNKYTVKPVTTFKGNSAVELQVDTAVLVPAPVAGTSVRTFNYINNTGTEAVYYGTKAETTTSIAGFNITTSVTSSYSPAWRFPFSLTSGQSFTNPASVVTIETNTGTGVTTTTQNQTTTYRFVGVESVSVAAGTFETCRVETSTATTTGGSTTTSSSTQWTIASGSLRGLFVKSQDKDGKVTEAKLVQLGH